MAGRHSGSGGIGPEQTSTALWQDAELLQPKNCQVAAGGSLFAIRRAGRGDAKQLSLLAEETFRDAFDAVNTPENMALHCRASYGEAIQAEEISDPNKVTFLCECDERLVGFAQLRWGEAPGCVTAGAPGEIQRLYMVRDCHGKGAAPRLMDACLEELRNRRSDVVWLGVWERNPRAITFYKKFGFVEVGAHVFLLGIDPQRDIVMARSVADGSPDR